VTLLGRIVRLQVQTANLKIGDGRFEQFDPSGITVVDELEVNDGGVRGWRNGAELSDIHHRNHPQSKLRGRINSISVGFTGHYDRMRQQFGDHLTNGIAGENILVEHSGLVTADDVERGLVLETAGGERIELESVVVAKPCAPFTRWSLRFPEGARPDRTVTEGLQFLDHGMRGFYCRYDGAPVRLRIGDAILLAA
jgi:hypothetical protein